MHSDVHGPALSDLASPSPGFEPKPGPAHHYGLKKNLPDALASVSLMTIRKWEHRMKRYKGSSDSGKEVRFTQTDLSSSSS
jgi:hypothetical protein